MSYELPNPPIFNWQNVEDRQLRYSLYELESYLYDLKNARTEDQKDLTTSSDKVFANLQLSSLTNNRLIGSNSVNTLVSVDLVDYIDGTTNQVTVTDDTDGTVTLSLPQDIDTGADVQFNSATLNDLDVDTLNLNGNVISDSTGTISFDNENLTTTGNITIDSDSSKLYLGDDQDLEIYHDGVDGYIDTQVGALKLNHNINGDVTLFQGTNPGDGNAGNKLKVYKYGKFLELYIDQWDNAIFQYGGGNIGIGSNNGTLNLQHNSEGNLSAFTNSVEGENRCFEQYGYISAASTKKYISWQVDDTDDYFHLSREDSNILGFKVDMPLETTDITISSPSNIYNLSHDNFADYVANEHIDWTSASSENLVAKTLKGVPEMHPEVAGNFIIPYYANDIAFLVQKGGSVSFSGDTLPSNGHTGDTYLFNGKSNSVQWNNPTGDIIVEVTLDKTYNFGTNVGYSSTDAFRARSTKIEAYDGTGWFLVNEASGLTSGQHNIHFGAGSTGVTKLRFTFSDFVNASIFRVSQIWLINYSSSLGNSYFLSKGGGEVLGFIGIVTDTAESREAFSITQNDDDKAFIDYSGTIDSSTTKNITSYTSGNSIQGFVKVEINGSEKWMPYYDAPTS